MFNLHLVLQAAGWPGALEFVLWRALCVCVLQSCLQWQSLPSGRKVSFLETWARRQWTLDVPTPPEQHISPVPPLVASSPVCLLLHCSGLVCGQPRLGSSGVPCRMKWTFTSWKHRCEPFPWDTGRTSKYSSVLSCVCWLFPCYLRQQTNLSLALGWPGLGSVLSVAHAASLAWPWPWRATGGRWLGGGEHWGYFCSHITI